MQLATSITIGGRTAIVADVTKLAGTRAFRRANAIFVPLGSAPSQAWFLMLRSDMDQLDRDSPLDIVWTNVSDTSSTTSRTFKNWYVVKSERLFKGGEDDPNALHVVEFTDARGIAARHTDTGSIIVNRRSYAQNDDYLTGTEGGTWVTLGTSLWNACGVLGAWPGLPFAPHGVPENTTFIGVSAWDSLCVFLDRLDCAVAHDPIAGTYSIVALGAAQAVADPTVPVWNGEPDGGLATEIPEKVRVYFHSHYEAYGQERDTELTNNWAYNGAGSYEEIATSVAGAVAGTIKVLWDDLAARLDEDGLDVNQADRTARATERKNKWLQRMQTTHAHKAFDGIHNIQCGGQIRSVLWRHWGDGNGTVTEYVAKPDLVMGIAPGAEGAACFLSSPANENYKTPDLGRHSYPNYPRLPNIVQVFHSGASLGDNVSANVDGFHAGRVRRWVANSLATLEDCWIRFVDGHDTANGDIDATNGEYYVARLSGVSTSEGSLLPVYLARKGNVSGAPFIEFALTASLAGGSAANTTVEDWWGGDNPGATVTVWDRQGLFKGARVGAQGIATLDTEENKWIVLECQSLAGWLAIELLADMSGAPAKSSSQVNLAKGTQQDVQTPGSTIDVYGIADLTDSLKTGVKTIALYSSEDDKYYALPPPSQPFWVATQAAWHKNGGSTPYVSCKIASSRTDTAGSGTAFNVYLPRSNDGDPNVVASKTILAATTTDGDIVCVSDYMDDKIGTTKQWPFSSSVPVGWAIVDGTNNASPGTGADARRRYLRVPHDPASALGIDGDDTDAASNYKHNHYIGCIVPLKDTGATFASGAGDAEFWAWAPTHSTYNEDGEAINSTTSSGQLYTQAVDPMFIYYNLIERMDNSSG